ncbi:hypothetical protein [Pseudoalteromonas luteoviolacea]|uniref:Virulence factor Evf domain-containing protein n=1 Tax=Pseudoalteromonas luteoviolacea S4054 TaxID=1129367 RepID=A0A0F6AFP6_9GAMM|nr:hypothetical protein [Pseudoalteromonas luteoviolacea]AOT08268.1 hypothetical protein S4054249_10630 [Pseudoalteromonas luteoviolacea]AOT13184.1 hypothetical protein S40542_10605 [Pseudoalteromonas luteoviolacea]AOT18097.1 hypothetical protein S4054_10605 [Pseudoalteromonas luteoviolacea]KKE84204.1 hypothetical protein N479_09910 [Pseudoalteromonas luteoviolacea S4054]KZN76191.1 hypothetical protein N481_07505 [Pseudoalteromonas luteoviolacea S4047-1]
MENQTNFTDFLFDSASERYEKEHPSYDHQVAFLKASTSLEEFLLEDHDQYVPGGNNVENTSSDSKTNVQKGTDAVEKFQAKSSPSEEEINELADAFIKHPSSAVSTLLNAARSAAGWNPVSGDTKESALGFKKYTDIISRITLLTISEASSEELRYEESNYNQLIDMITDTLSGIFEGSTKKIKSSLVDLAKACTSQSNTENTATVFSQNEVTTENSGKKVSYSIAYTFMKMELSHQSGKSAPADKFKEETLTVGAKFDFDVDTFTNAQAKKLARLKLGVSTLEQFVEATTTPEAPKPIKFCLDSVEGEPA